MPAKRVMIIGAAGRVGLPIASALCRSGCSVVLVDVARESLLRQKIGRTLLDAHILAGECDSDVSVFGGIDALDRDALAAILASEQPDLVINYAIPITWDATKRLSNYSAVSAAGLGAFAAIQLVAPLTVSRAIRDAGLNAGLIVGNLPDITAPVVAAVAAREGGRAPLCGAGNVGLIQCAIRSEVARDRRLPLSAIDVDLVAHHVHWVAPREPGYSNGGPFHLRVRASGEDISTDFGEPRELMNRAIRNHYEADASFSSTTGYLAAQLALAFLDDSGAEHHLHAPAPNGLPGGYPVRIAAGEIAPRLPAQWAMQDLRRSMEICHTLDGVTAIEEDGTVCFADRSRQILREELDFDLPARMPTHDIGTVAAAQIAVLRRCFERLS